MSKKINRPKTLPLAVLITRDFTLKAAWENLFKIFGRKHYTLVTLNELDLNKLGDLSTQPGLIIFSFPRREDNHISVLMELRECKQKFPSADITLLADKMSDYAFSRAYYHDKYHLVSLRQSLDALWSQIAAIMNKKHTQYVSPSFNEVVMRIHKPSALSTREAEVFYLSGLGHSVQFIGQYQNRSIQTISTLKRRAMMKLNMHHIIDIFHLMESDDINELKIHFNIYTYNKKIKSINPSLPKAS